MQEINVDGGLSEGAVGRAAAIEALANFPGNPLLLLGT
jgi:hypothetical protein